MASQFYCLQCETWVRKRSDAGPTIEQRRAHAARCMGRWEDSDEAAGIDAELERIAALYVS
jgi:hypothetical protein